MVVAILILSITTIVCFILYLRCNCNKYNTNYKKIISLTRRLEELESKLHMITTDMLLTSKKTEVLI